jgi:hypothetical protein
MRGEVPPDRGDAHGVDNVFGNAARVGTLFVCIEPAVVVFEKLLADRLLLLLRDKPRDFNFVAECFLEVFSVHASRSSSVS